MADSSYQRAHRLAAPVLAFTLDREAEGLIERARSATAGRAAETLVKDGAVRLTLIAMTGGTTIDSHTAPGPITIHALRGSLRVRHGDSATTVPAGSLIAIEAGLVHHVQATEESAFLLTLFVNEGTKDETPAAKMAEQG
ncbi:MAG: cupin domain-containing protein [Hyphomicrobiales bacterium]